MASEWGEDVAFVLETVAGVQGVYELASRADAREDRERRAGGGDRELLIHMEQDQRAIVAAHYALLKIMRHEDYERVLIVRMVPTSLEARLAPIVLAGPQRFAAMNRVSARAKLLAEERAAAVEAEKVARMERPAKHFDLLSILLFSEDEAVHQAMCEAFPGARISFVGNLKNAIGLTRYRYFDFVFCRAQGALGMWGFIAGVAEHKPQLAREIVVVIEPGERDIFKQNLRVTRRDNRCLPVPVTPESIRLVSKAPLGFEVLNVPTSTSTSTSTPTPTSTSTPVRRFLVLLVDDEPDTEALATALAPAVHLIRVSDEWSALDKIAVNDLDLVLCNARMKVAGGKPLYRLLWNTRPAIKSRFALIIDPHNVPASARDGRARGAITRPVSASSVRDLLSALPPKL